MSRLQYVYSKRFIALGYLLIIAIGTLLLALPLSNKSSSPLPFIDVLFTATSATCVTGLTIADTYSQFTYFGQAVLLILIQVGGLGFMSLAIFFLMLSGSKITLKERSLLSESLNVSKLGGILRVVQKAALLTLFCELVGAALLSLHFIPEYGPRRGVWFALFHAISAFCNAGFDLMGAKHPFSSLNTFSQDPLVLLTIALLIITGGLGFIVYQDLFEKKFRFQAFELHTKVVLSMSALLIIGATI
ncbi:MAG: potassium transporter TrkG, partial [Coriobacteriia bacterium]|nr:potassium transporter TrkG [Coriobacteriia bacterium]